ncbi:hypothetical protein IAD21_02333 [Abditibacteriota bacterium]|nr:hypothetical protein IAD21_02333 [Abditibacteriota bacterium]
MPLISELLQEVLVCPVCHGELEVDEAKSVLRCKNDGLEFPVRDGIPIMMVNDAGQPMSEAEEAEMKKRIAEAEEADDKATVGL